MYCTDLGIIISLKDLQHQKAALPILVTELGIKIFFKLEQPENILLLMDFIDIGSSIVCNELHLEKTELPQ